VLSRFRPLLSARRPTSFSIERIVVQRLSLFFGTSKAAQKQSARTERELFFHILGELDPCLALDKEIGEVSISNES
jgi:hypothetical protein